MSQNSASATDDRIEDPGEYNQRRRLQAVHDALDTIHERRSIGKEALQNGRIDRFTYLSSLREAVESMLLELEPAIKQFQAGGDDERDGDYYWNEVDLGSVYLPPDNTECKFQGLKSILEFPDPYEAEWTVDKDPPSGFETHPRGQTEVQSQQIQIPKRILRKAERTVREFMHQVGLDLGFDRTSHDEGDVDDLEALLRARGQEQAADELPTTNSE